jgi:hypothetical protein
MIRRRFLAVLSFLGLARVLPARPPAEPGLAGDRRDAPPSPRPDPPIEPARRPRGAGVHATFPGLPGLWRDAPDEVLDCLARGMHAALADTPGARRSWLRDYRRTIEPRIRDVALRQRAADAVAQFAAAFGRPFGETEAQADAFRELCAVLNDVQWRDAGRAG